MPEVEMKEVQESIEHAHRHAEHDAQSPSWLRWVSLSTALLAVIAAVAALKAEILINEALLRKNEAVLYQAQASDQWAYFQSKSLKRNGAQQTADLLAANPVTIAHADRYRKEAKRYQQEQDAIAVEARRLEKLRDRKNHDSHLRVERQHLFAYCVTFTQIAIALSAIAALTRIKPVWFLSMIIGGVGFFWLVDGLVNPLSH